MFQRTKKLTLAVLFFSFANTAFAGQWSAPTKVTDVGAWGPWLGLVVTDTGAAVGCSGAGAKVIDISSGSPTSKAQSALIMIAAATGQKVVVYYDFCEQGASVITNVHLNTP